MAKKHYNATHGMSGTKTYRSWEAMKRRCENPKSTQFAYYGGRGITICKAWDSFEIFFKEMGPKPKDKTLDRIDPNGNYFYKNCRWANQSEQMQNTRRTIQITHCGKTLILKEWSARLGIRRDLLYQRYTRDHLRPPKLFKPVAK